MFFVVQDITFVTQLFLCKKCMNAQGGRKLEFLWKDILSSILTSPFVLVIQIYCGVRVPTEGRSGYRWCSPPELRTRTVKNVI